MVCPTEDVAWGSICYENALKKGIGTKLHLWNEYIYKPTIAALHLPCPVLFQERYGNGEPTDTMTDAILEAAQKYAYRRIIAITEQLSRKNIRRKLPAASC